MGAAAYLLGELRAKRRRYSRERRESPSEGGEEENPLYARILQLLRRGSRNRLNKSGKMPKVAITQRILRQKALGKQYTISPHRIAAAQKIDARSSDPKP